MSSVWEQLVEPIVPNGAQSINLVSVKEQESESNQTGAELDAENLHKVYYKHITIDTCMCWQYRRDFLVTNRVKIDRKSVHKLYACAAYKGEGGIPPFSPIGLL